MNFDADPSVRRVDCCYTLSRTYDVSRFQRDRLIPDLAVLERDGVGTGNWIAVVDDARPRLGVQAPEHVRVHQRRRMELPALDYHLGDHAPGIGAQVNELNLPDGDSHPGGLEFLDVDVSRAARTRDALRCYCGGVNAMIGRRFGLVHGDCRARLTEREEDEQHEDSCNSTSPERRHVGLNLRFGRLRISSRRSSDKETHT